MYSEKSINELKYIKELITRVLDPLKGLILKLNPISISYPNGSFNKYTLKIIENLRLRCGFISSMKSYNKNYKKKFTLRRLDHSNILKNFLSK